MRPFSILSPSFDSRAGRTVSEPIIATATTTIVPVANDVKSSSPPRYIPPIANITVQPEISTARPEVAAAASSAASGPAPGGSFLALAPDVEQAVVDPDGQSDQQDHRD